MRTVVRVTTIFVGGVLALLALHALVHAFLYDPWDNAPCDTLPQGQQSTCNDYRYP